LRLGVFALKNKMNNRDELLKYVEWDVRNWAVALDFWLSHTTKRLSECRVLEIGADYGGLSLWLASRGAKVVCSDLYGVRREAVESHEASGLMPLIEHAAIDAANIPYTEEFDVVVFKSVLGGIVSGEKEPQAKVVGELHRALKKGGELFFAENLVASPVHMFFRRKANKWGTTWRYLTIEEMNEFLTPFSRVQHRIIGFTGAFGRTEAQRNLLALGDKLIFERIVPESWKYIIAGVARK
jgi:2-polyprenyl-3-methyl-5-hydroxy-6-metoxy-1,4-benzoquinol methylase